MVDAANADADRALNRKHKKADVTMDAFKHMTQINHEHRQEHRSRAMELLQHEDELHHNMLHKAADQSHEKDMAELAAEKAMQQAKNAAKQQAKQTAKPKPSGNQG